MANTPESGHENPQGKAAARRMEAEISKVEAERLKLELEAQEVKKRLKQRWYSGRLFFQSLLAGIVGAALVAGYGLDIMRPIMDKQAQLNDVETRLLNKKIEEVQIIFQEDLAALNDQNQFLAAQFDSLLADSDRLREEQAHSEEYARSLQSQMEELSDMLEQLAGGAELSPDQRTSYATLSGQASQDLQAISNNIDMLSAAKVATEKRSERIQDQQAAREFRGRWVNEDTDTRGITRTEIAITGDSLAVEMWGKCHPTDCPWGIVKTELSDVDDGQFDITWDQSFVEVTQSLSILPDGRLKVKSSSHFTDKSGRQDSENDYFFVREIIKVQQLFLK